MPEPDSVHQEEECSMATEGSSITGIASDGSIRRESDDGDEIFDDDILEGETPEEALQRRIEEGKIGKGKTLRRWKNTEEKQRAVETGRYQSKVQRYGQIYEEVRALRKETRSSVQDLRERFKKEGVIQNKDQFIVRLIAQERNEQQGKVAAIKSLQQWRLTDVELHNFINRCHKKGTAGKLDLANQWAFEQEEAGGEVNFKEGLAFYSSIGILQPRSSAQTQQQWREWREWEDAMATAVGRRTVRGGSVGSAADVGPDASSGADDSTVCNSPWSSERGGGGSFGGFNGSLRASSAHGEGDAAGGYGSSRFFAGLGLSGTAPETSIVKPRLRRGRTAVNRDSPRQKRGWWQWRSYSPPGPSARYRGEDLPRIGTDKRKAPIASLEGADANGSVETVPAENGIRIPPPIPLGAETPDASGAPKIGEAVVRAGGGYLPPRHPLAVLNLSPSRTSAADDSAGRLSGAELGRGSEGGPDTVHRGGATARGAARTGLKGPAGGITPKQRAEQMFLEDAPTEEEGGRPRSDGEDDRDFTRKDRHSLASVFAGLADWLMPGMEGPRRVVDDTGELHPSTPPGRGTKSAPVTPRGRAGIASASVLREGGWFYRGDSDYSSSDGENSFESEDEGFWADAGTFDPRNASGTRGLSILERLRRLFT